MTTMTSWETTAPRHARTEGASSSRMRGAAFGSLLALAALVVLALLVLGPALPVAATIPLAVLALALVAAGWIIGAPRS